ncbi:MAG: TetR/AcrR family transcriptional regulator [Anaerolinea sp.]|nr:TetR/AcrR family transcriptional regulator [Anaerolinea sp.]
MSPMDDPRAGPAPAADTRGRVLDVAEAMAQTRGFNGFSYADISAEVGITKASLHYHFRTKADLGRSLIARYRGAFRAALDAITASGGSALERLHAYVLLYASVVRDDRMCLCGMFAAEYRTLPAAMQEEIRGFFDENESWLAEQLDEGRRAGELAFDGLPRETAMILLGALEGMMLVARSYGDAARFEASAKRLIEDLRPG